MWGSVVIFRSQKVSASKNVWETTALGRPHKLPYKVGRSTSPLCVTLWRCARTAPDIKHCTDVGASCSVRLAAHHLHKELGWPQRLYGPDRVETNSAPHSNITRIGQSVRRRLTDHSHINPLKPELNPICYFWHY